MIREVIKGGAAEKQGGIAFCEVWAFDSPDARLLAMKYMLTTIPTLLAFDDAQNPRFSSRLVDPGKMGDRLFLNQWLEDEAREGGTPGSGGGVLQLSGIFERWKK